MINLNLHHLRYFRHVAREGNLTRAAAQLNVSQSALSIQIKQLEERIGRKLFERTGRTLTLTEAGRVALDHADRIFDAEADLVATLGQESQTLPPLRIGAQSTLSRNFQIAFLRPAIAKGDCQIRLRSADSDVLLSELKDRALDIVLTTEPPVRGHEERFAATAIAEQQLGIHGRADLLEGVKSLKDLIENRPLIVPTGIAVRAEFENLAQKLRVTPNIIADVDDMAMIRLLTVEGFGLAVAPAVVLESEIHAGTIMSAPFDLPIREPFYAVTVPREFPHPLLDTLMQAELTL
ncbi:MAG: LysR family transcriptional regulator [Pseudomonadota bacterium]